MVRWAKKNSNFILFTIEMVVMSVFSQKKGLVPLGVKTLGCLSSNSFLHCKDCNEIIAKKIFKMK